MTNDLTIRLAALIAKCWTDQEFKARFLKDPKAVIAEAVLELPPGAELVVVEDTQQKRHFVLPAMPPEGFTTAALDDAVHRAVGDLVPPYCRAEGSPTAVGFVAPYCAREEITSAAPYCRAEEDDSAEGGKP